MDLLPLRIFYNLYSIAKILALVYVTRKFWVTMDTNNEPVMLVHTGPYSIVKFYQCHKWLYYFDTSTYNVFNPSVNAYYLVTTIQENTIFSIYTKFKERMLP